VIGIQGDALSKLKKALRQILNSWDIFHKKSSLRITKRQKFIASYRWREGLRNALCEAMLCECIPVGTERNGIPIAIGDAGFYVPYGDPVVTANAIQARPIFSW